ncbi:helix-turn-helix domain-containing protein [Streptomyces fulvoviolaceus]|uniref:helix-turn-helix domain-containing protein n=1 Tax=Streptomyces fulvoviolaceus TaxID=285535 RepID=UPI0021BE5256|nr:helix-turn-helix transcriptional regulator [Streptomyces fulvoviolaceus]MCT9079330.1 helix-turn-helix domain-containing protein [Streptomyces fulvoviolaceus]
MAGGKGDDDSRAANARPPVEDNIAERVKLEREARGWSSVTLAEKMAEAGHAIGQSAIWRIESGKPRRRINTDEALGFCKVFDMTLDELSSPPGQMANPIIRRLVGEYVERWKEWRALGKSMDAIQDQLREYTKANPDQDTMVRNMLAVELDAASNGDFHRHRGARSRLTRWLGDAYQPSAPADADVNE